MSLEFPRLAYKQGGPWQLELGNFSVREVTAEEFEALKSEGWALTMQDALMPPRAELERRAAELGIQYRPQWGDKKLAAAIAEAESK